MKGPEDIAEDNFDQTEDAWDRPSEEREIHEFVDLAGQAAAELSDADNALAALEEPGDSLDEDDDITTAMGMEINTEPEGSTLLDLYQNWESALEDEDVQPLDEPVTEEQADAKAFTAQSASPDLTPVTGPDQTPLAATAEQIEAVVEKVLTRLLADKIEARVIETIEKAVSKEIERLREALIEDSMDHPEK
jgi:hypothetical protein